MSSEHSAIEKLKGSPFQIVEAEYVKCGYHLEARLNESQVRDFAGIMLDAGFFLDFVTAVHVAPCFQVVYQFAHFDEVCRVNAKVMANEKGEIPTISDIYHGASWHERETHDFYGVVFTGHPDLRTLLLSEEDADLKPLLKIADKLVGVETVTRKSGADAEKKPAKKTIEE